MKATYFLSFSGLLLITLFFFLPNDHSLKKANTTVLEPTVAKRSSIRVALLLDTSSSMSGLIEQAKSQLWQIVNELTKLKQNGQTPDLYISLYEYGKSQLSAREGYISQLVPFTTDMDLVSEHLFALSTVGGEEYCGMVIQRSLQSLDWGGHPSDLRMIYIAGNESFQQGPVSYLYACKLAEDMDVQVHTIYCGGEQSGIREGWKTGAENCQGSFMTIEHNRATAYIKTPYDDDIQQLNNQLNDTYIPFGKEGHSYRDNQLRQDKNAEQYGLSNAANRAVFKSSSNYSSGHWDLVDAYEKDPDILKNKKALGKELENKSTSDLQQLIQNKKSERANIRKEIRQLDQQRQNYLQEKSQANGEAQDLQNSILESIRKLAAKKNYTYASVSGSGLPPSNIDYPAFSSLTSEVNKYRQKRLVNLPTFKQMARDQKTIILDTRSKPAFENKHLRGAIHLNFSDFSEEKLAKLIPDKNTRILIYCNNNIVGDQLSFAGKMAPLALNIPTFINLYGYGYRNVYELSDLVEADSGLLEFSGHLVNK